VSAFTGGGLVSAIIDIRMGNFKDLFAAENTSTSFIKSLPSEKKKLKEALLDFFSDRYIVKYKELKEKIAYKTIPPFFKLYNSK
jgi:hypothetical protein